MTTCYKGEFVLRSILAFIAAIRAFFRSRSDTALEVLALRQQVAVLKRQHPRPRLNSLDRLFWTTLRRYWPRWSDVLLIVKPATVVGWHRGGFRLYWRWRSRPRGGWPATTAEIRTHIRTMASENSGWGAPKIHGELLKLGFEVSERTVARYMRRIRRRGDPGRQWLSFLQNHREVTAAVDFFTVPTLTFPTASSSSSTDGAASCTSTLPDIRLQLGLCNNCAKHSRKQRHIATSSWIETPSSTMR